MTRSLLLTQIAELEPRRVQAKMLKPFLMRSDPTGKLLTQL